MLNLRAVPTAAEVLARIEAQERSAPPWCSAKYMRDRLIAYCNEHDFMVTMKPEGKYRYHIQISNGKRSVHAWNSNEVLAIEMALVVAQRELASCIAVGVNYAQYHA